MLTEHALKLDLTHTINHISFGDESHVKHIIDEFGVGILNPLDSRHVDQVDENKIYEYYLKVVPSIYQDINDSEFKAHQFTANSNTVEFNMIVPTIFFRYDISPILVRIVQYKQKFFHFFIQICAIVGGIYTVTGILDSLIHKMFTSEKKSSN